MHIKAIDTGATSRRLKTQETDTSMPVAANCLHLDNIVIYCNQQD